MAPSYSGLSADHTFVFLCPRFVTYLYPTFVLSQALSRKGDFSDADIDAFQSIADDFFREWLDLVGYDGIANYIHMLGAGHMRYYLQKWRNLNRFQNQGWEGYNNHVACYWHHRTQKGGRGRSKILPIAKWLLRLMMWKTGTGQQFFQQLELNGGIADIIEEDNGNSDDEND